MKRLFLLLALSQALSAEQFFVSNRRFATVEKRDGVWLAPLSALAPALQLPLTQVGSNWVLGTPAEEALAGDGGAYFQGKRLQSVRPDLQVDVKSFIQEIGGRYIENRALGSVDLYAPTKMLARKMSCNNVHLLVFHKASASGQQVESLGESLHSTAGLEPVPIDIADETHPLWQQWKSYWSPGPMPLVVMVDPAGRVLGSWSGQLPPSSQLQQTFTSFRSQRAQTNSLQVAMPASSRGGGGGGG